MTSKEKPSFQISPDTHILRKRLEKPKSVKP